MADDTRPNASRISGAYRVLARKYRPAGFEDLIGQEAMVRTLTNAFASDRIHQAYIFTGVRGVGKTTTARIIARALNYELPDGSVKAPRIDMPVHGTHCEAIIESRHVDVIEMDAASNTGVGDVREIIDAVRYKPAYARYKIYIIDEVHMLSNNAFNALLKTLEEPPDHVKFLFATTEIRKVPITVLSRCQRFDLRRIEQPVMVAHLAGIAAKEGVTVEDEALAAIARASEGSVRDALSLMDQAIALAAGPVTAEAVRGMLGIADRTQVIRLFETLMAGQAAEALDLLKELYAGGGDPAAILADLAAFVHLVTRMKIAPTTEDDPTLSVSERTQGRGFADRLSIRALTRAWQILSRGMPEVQQAERPLPAADMVLIKLAYAADLPTPDEVIRRLRDEGAGGSAGASSGRASPSGGTRAMASGGGRPAGTYQTETVQAQPSSTATPRPVLASAQPVAQVQTRPAPAAPAVALAAFPALVALAHQKRDPMAIAALERDVRPVRFEDGLFEFALASGADAGVVQMLGRKLQEWTGRRWNIAVSNEPGLPTIREQEQARKNARRADLIENPVVRAVMDAFPGAELVVPEAPEPVAALPEPDVALQVMLNEDGDIVAGEGDDPDVTADDL
jgi:DNA polymerase III subunit gamma/tau